MNKMMKIRIWEDTDRYSTETLKKAFYKGYTQGQKDEIEHWGVCVDTRWQQFIESDDCVRLKETTTKSNESSSLEGKSV